MNLFATGGLKSLGSGEVARLAAFARPYRGRLTIALIAMLGAAGLGLSMPIAMRMLIDSALVRRDSHRLNLSIIALLAIFAGQAVFSFLRTYLLTYTGESIVADLRSRL